MARSPLFDIYDPYGELEERSRLGLLDDEEEYVLQGPVSLRKPQISDLMPEEEKTGLLRSLAEMGTSGLAAAGYLLDTPGALVRGILAGKPLSVFGTADERVDGRELLRQYGLIGEKNTWGNFAGGLAGEVLLDPLTYLNPLAILGRGAYNRVGKAMQSSGFFRNAAEAAYEGLDPTLQQAARGAAARPAGTGIREYTRRMTPRQAIAESADPAEALARWQRQAERFGVDPADLDARPADLINIGIPHTNLSFGTDIFGEAFGDRVARGLDWLGEQSKRNPYTGPLVNTLYAGFHAPSGGTLNPDVQWDARIARARADRANEAQELLRTGQLRRAMDANAEQVAEQMRAAGASNVPAAIPEGLRQFQSTDLQRALVDYAESSGVPVAPGVFGPLPKSSGDDVADWVLENVPEFRDIRDTYVDSMRLARDAARDAGLPVNHWQGASGTEFFPRQSKWWRQIMNPDRPDAVGRVERPYTQGQTVLGTADNFGRGRRAYTDIPGGQRTFRMLTGNANQSLDSAALQQALIDAPNAAQARRLLDRAFDTINVTRPFRDELQEVMASPAFQSTGDLSLLEPAYERLRANQDELIDLLRGADLQFAQNNTGLFDTPGWTNLRRYERGQNRVLANSQRVVQRLQENIRPIPAGGPSDGLVPLTAAAQQLGFDDRNFRDMWQTRFGTDITNLAVPENLVAALKTVANPTRLGDAERGMVGAIDQFTNAFKVGALASPAFHVRNTYSGNINAAAFGAFNPLDWWASLRASMGNTDALARRLRDAPGFESLTDAERVARFQDLTGANRVGGGVFADDVTGLPEQEIRGTWLGAGNTPSVGRAFYDANRSWPQFANDFFSMRGVGITQNASPTNTNPLLVFNDAVGSTAEDAMRGGVFLNQLRKGVDPGEAADLVRMSQVDYSPQAFTDFERNFMKRVMPFYSFQKGILPSIANNLLYRPGGLMGQSIRAVTRGTQPNEDNFVPEHLRQSAAIPLPPDLPSLLGGSGNPNLQRYLTNIDLPWESTFQLFTPGVGATTSAAVADTIQKVGSNLLGQANPLIKAPIEYITDRQLYSGRDLSDLYSVLERDFGEVGRPAEQIVTNFVPFGSRALGTYRQLTDDRLNPGDRYTKAAWNLLAGAKLTDIDQERSKRLAARQMLNELLSTTPGVRTYENITVPEEVLRQMPKEQRDMYLLYKIVQAEAAKRARDRKRAEETALDPLQVLGVVNQF